jgi:ubiquinone/menaquinone biosynthesis C-methylase UbiE
MYRVLKPHGRLVMSDPTSEQEMNEKFTHDDHFTSLCLSGNYAAMLL